MTDFLSVLSRWFHIIPAIIMFGGVIFMRCCLVGEKEGSIFDSNDAMRKRWGKLVMLSTLLLLGSGLYNTAVKAMSYDLSSIYNVLLLAKIILALVVFVILATLSGRSERAKKFRQREAHWLNILIVMMLLVVMMAGYMKIGSTDFEKKEKKSAAANVEASTMPMQLSPALIHELKIR